MDGIEEEVNQSLRLGFWCAAEQVTDGHPSFRSTIGSYMFSLNKHEQTISGRS